MRETNETNLVTADEIAVRLRVRPGTVRDWARRGIIPSVKLGAKTIRYSPSAVVEALSRRGNRQPATQGASDAN